MKPDVNVLRLLEDELASDGHIIFIDRHMQIGVEWAHEIERQIRESDAVVVLLSAASVGSEMLTYEVQLAQQAAVEQDGKPRLLPVRVGYDDPLPIDLGRVLDPVQCFSWSNETDDERLVAAIRESLSTSNEAQTHGTLSQLEPPLGAIPIDSEFYLLRDADAEYQAALARGDSIVLVRGARQMGKTSLMARGLKLARDAGTHVVLTDFQKLNTTDLASAESFFLALGDWLADRLDLDASPHDSWNERRGASVNFERFLRREILAQLTAPLVWGLDEVDRLFTCDYSSEVFGLFRSWHNERALDPTGPWSKLTLAIAYATEAHLFITDINQSPFNVGTRISLTDFSLPQVAELNRRYGSPLASRDDVEAFVGLVGGQPYLANRGLYELVQRGWSVDQLAATAASDEGIFGDHLRRMIVLLAQDGALCQSLRDLLAGRGTPTTEQFYRLRSAGILAGDTADDCRPRCGIYQTYLGERL